MSSKLLQKTRGEAMKNELILIGAIMLCAQVEGQMAKNTLLKNQLSVSSQAINKLSNMHIERQTHTYKYVAPIAKEDYNKKTSPFSYREMLNPFTGGQVSSWHKGVDIVGLWHCTIRPIDLNGEVIDKWYVPTNTRGGHEVFGGYVRIKHPDGWISAYGHLSSIYVKEGDKLIDGIFYRNGVALQSKGILGRQGNTGQSTGEHLHLSIQRPDGVFVDPLRWVKL